MGIPKFAKWLIHRYPTILKKIKNDQDVPEIDNLYLDINGVIHLKSHNNSISTMCLDRKDEEIYYEVFLYIDQLVHLIRPQKVLMISADGVAPRAKMNQQRTRRFRKTQMTPKEMDELKKSGVNTEKMFNSDSISSGTSFMTNLIKAFDYFIAMKISSDPLWKNIKVVFSGSDVPGEGEHKIIEYIRKNKSSSDYNPKTRHCVYGLDADLIMLSLITHEPSIAILREEVLFGKQKTNSNSMRSTVKVTDNFEFIFISILREYLELEFIGLKDKLSFEFNIERILDDFVFFCFFIGNDFLPSLNTLDIDEGSLNLIFKFYSKSLLENEGYITDKGKIDFKRAEKIFTQLAKNELDSLYRMLKKLEKTCNDRLEKKTKALNDQRNLLKKKKINSKKTNFLLNLKKEMSNVEIVKYKKDKIQNKLNNYKQEYSSLMDKLGKKEYKFEDDVNDFSKKHISKMIQKFHKNLDSVDETEMTEFISDTNQDPKETERKHTLDNINKEINEKLNTQDDDKQGNLGSFFDSDGEKRERKKFQRRDTKENKDQNNKVSLADPERTSEDERQRCLKKASKFLNYLKDENYYSDLNIEDISDGEIGPISDIELLISPESNLEHYDEYQDMEKVFQQKLIEYYIKDVNEAKKFYYKEKVKIDLDTEEGKNQHKFLFRKYLEGLQWVMHYYYSGIKSWRWYYPSHYPPMISDFENIKDFLDYDFDNAFSKDQPFQPFQSLLMILPEKSKNLLPLAYQSVFKDPLLEQYYPDKFVIDFNGKRLPWESLVILPFIPEKLILEKDYEIQSKYACDVNLLSEEERKLILNEGDLLRNQFAKSYIYSYSESSSYNSKSFLREFSDLNDAKVGRVEYEVYQEISIDYEINNKKKDVAYNFPSLKSNDFMFCFHKVVKQNEKFKKNAKRIDMISVYPNNIYQRKTESEFLAMFNQFLSQPSIFYNYPYKQEGYLSGLYYQGSYFYLDPKTKEVRKNVGRISDEILGIIKNNFSYKKGIAVTDLQVLCEIYPFKRYARNQDGSLTKIYEEKPKFLPFEVTSLNSITQSEFEELRTNLDQHKKNYENPSKEFPMKSVVVILAKKNFGMLGKVERHIPNTDKDYDNLSNKNCSEYYDSQTNYDLSNDDYKVSFKQFYKGLLLEVSVNENFQISPITDNIFSKNLVKNNNNQQYIKLLELAKQMNIQPSTLNIITSNCFVVNCNEHEENSKLSDLQHWNIGLNLKAIIKNQSMILPGFTRSFYEPHFSYEESIYSWEFSEEAVKLLNEYKTSFPFVFECLDKYQEVYKTSRYYKSFELFALIDNLEQKLNVVVSFINNTNVNKVSFASNNSMFLPNQTIKTIKETVEKKTAELLTKNRLFSTKLFLNPNYAFIENTPWTPMFLADAPPQFELGDRVVNISSIDLKYIPFGLKGTVSAVAENYIEVVFDKSFFGGTTLNGRLEDRSGITVNPLTLLNLTRKPPVFLRRNFNKYTSWNFSSFGLCNRQGHFDVNYLQKSYSHNSYSKGYNEDLGVQKSFSNEFYKNNYQSRNEIEVGANFTDSLNKQTNLIVENQVNEKKQENISSNIPNNPKKILLNRTDKKAEIFNRYSQNTISEISEIKPKQREDVNRFVRDDRGTKRIILKKDNVGMNSSSNTESNHYGKQKLFPEEDLKPNQMYFYNNSKSKLNEEKLEKKKEYLIIK